MRLSIDRVCGRIFPTREDDKRFRILLADQPSTYGDALRMMINDSDDMHVCAEACHTFGVLEIIQHCDPHLIMIGATCVNSGALRLIRMLRLRRPLLKIVVMTTLTEAMYGERFFAAGACASFDKFEPMDLLLGRVRGVLAGRPAVRSLPPALTELSDREVQLFTLCGRSLSRRSMAVRMGLSWRTVEIHLERIRVKLGLEPGGLDHFAARWHKGLSHAARAVEDEIPVSDLAPEDAPASEPALP